MDGDLGPPDTAPQELGKVEATIAIDPAGGVTISFPSAKKPRDAPSKFNENLAKRGSLNASGIVDELLDGVEADIKSRTGFTESYTNALDLLGIEIKDDKREKFSQIGHPLLLESVVRAQSAAGGELMPASGPCKVETVGGSDAASDALARALQDDMNGYLSGAGAPEYYPDFDRGLFGLFYSGNLFRKIYYHMIRRRPVAESIGIEDLIVTESATDLETAIRVTHRSEMTPQQVRQMQRYADWVDDDLGQAQLQFDSLKMAQERLAGYNRILTRPSDVPFEIYEVTTDLDLTDYGLELSDAPDIPAPYIVTIEKGSRKLLALRRGWVRGDPHYKRRQRFVHYGMIPGFNFLCLGFMHLLGNQTKALRGIWRLLVTSGMYANAPGGLRAKGVRLGQSEVRPGPGEWPDIDIGSFDDIKKALMPMPYKDVSAQFMTLAQSIGADANRLAGAVEATTGEGLSNVPVGTMMSMVEQSTQVMAAIHKRLHRAQSRELQLIKDCFSENPESLSRLPSIASAPDMAAAFANLNLIPASDPNVPSQLHRIQLSTALVTVAGQNPDLYDRTAVHMRAWRTIGVNDPQSFILPQPAPPPPPKGGAAPPDPAIGQARLAEAQAKMQQVQQGQVDLRRKAAEATMEAQSRQAEMQAKTQAQIAEMQSRERIAQQQTQIEQIRLEIEQARLTAEHARDVQSQQLQAGTQRYVADRQAAADHHDTTTSAETARHVARVQKETAVAAAQARPKPKPSGEKK